jgi:hypothetical protein
MVVDPNLLTTIVCTYGGQYDTSYATVEEANEVAYSHLNTTKWDALNESQKAFALITATRDIDTAFNWVGWRYFYNQNLEFPRKMTEDIYSSEPDSSYYDMLTTSQYQTIMKRNVKLACIEQAIWLAKNSGEDEHGENMSRGISSVQKSYGSVNESYNYRGSAQPRLCSDARRFLREYRSYPRLVRG